MLRTKSMLCAVLLLAGLASLLVFALSACASPKFTYGTYVNGDGDGSVELHLNPNGTFAINNHGTIVSEPEDQPKAADHLINAILKLLARDFVLGSSANAKVIQFSDLDWTIPRFPRVTDGAHTGKYRVGYIGKDSGTQISRADGADFVLKELAERKWIRKAPSVSY